RAVVSRSDRHAVVVEYRADIVWMEVAEVEGHDAASLARIGRAVHHDILELTQVGESVVSDLHLVLTYVLHAQLVQVIDRRAKSDHIGDVRRSGLELPGQV